MPSPRFLFSTAPGYDDQAGGEPRMPLLLVADDLSLDRVRTAGLLRSALPQLAVALHEALSNALFHGNLGLSSELREQPGDVYWHTAAQRSQCEPWRHRRIRVRAVAESQVAKFSIRDEGDGFDWASTQSSVSDELLSRAYGRGIPLMRLFAHDVECGEGGREVTLVIRRQSLESSG